MQLELCVANIKFERKVGFEEYMYCTYVTSFIIASPSSSCVYHQMANSVSCSHALVSGPKWKRPASEGGLYRGQPVIMCSAVCSVSPHWHAALSDRPHFFIEDLKRPTPQRRRFSAVHWWRGRSSPFTPPAGSWMYRCMREGSTAQLLKTIPIRDCLQQFQV